MAPAKQDGRRHTAASAVFSHAIRRADGILLYRTATVEQAVGILERLAQGPS